MATKALTPVAPRASRDRMSAINAPGRGQDWRQLFTDQDAQAIWLNLFQLISSFIPDDPTRCEQLAQETFLYLIASGRLDHYVRAEFSNDEIEEDLTAYFTD